MLIAPRAQGGRGVLGDIGLPGRGIDLTPQTAGESQTPQEERVAGIADCGKRA